MPKVAPDTVSRARAARRTSRQPAATSMLPQRIPPIQRESLEEQTYARLRTAIIERRIMPGQRIPVDRLAKDFRISRTPILNALKRLAQERVVDCVSRRGVFVRRFSKREMARLFEVREALEGMAVRLAVPRIALREIRALEKLFQGFDRPLTAASIRRYIERDRYFHWRLVELAGNEQLMAALDSVNMMFFAYQDGVVRPPEETVPEHRAILRAMGSRDPEAGEAAMRLHIRRSIERLEHEAEEDARATEALGAERAGGVRGRRLRSRGAMGMPDGNATGGRHHERATR
jgi:GntR family transcriptional regulator, rspAB operon transcriptional repressor